ncbi:hypothetical protein ANN_25647 [Periplaneta americana]|uniref:Reverse transcriptase domain-containing protein n=1 Tax=Periplaneta americana TaxID=6978 RepID=A0ABQ8S3R8_PERAM|nr:hypothetical protein ANN_25647 [Periplaneta americana]
MVEENKTKWKDHVDIMAENRLPKKIMNYRPIGKRDLGRPRKRWLDDRDRNRSDTRVDKNVRFIRADDVNMLGQNPQTIRENMEILLEASKAMGLEVNPEKTKYVSMSRDENIVRNGNIKIGNLSFEEVEKFKYLEATVTKNDTREEIKRRINMGNACYYSVEKLLSFSLLSKNLKVRIYKTVILPVVLYGCETWTLTLREEHRLRVFENKVLRKIIGAKRDEVTGEWRELHNTELHALYCSPDIIRNIKSRRLRWAGHVARMGESRNAYRVLVGRPEGKRPLGRPRRRWEDNIKMDLREFKVCHGSLYDVMWLVDEPREFNLPTLPHRCITYVPEKLPSKYGVHSEEYLPIRTVTPGSGRNVNCFETCTEKFTGDFSVRMEMCAGARTVSEWYHRNSTTKKNKNVASVGKVWAAFSRMQDLGKPLMLLVLPKYDGVANLALMSVHALCPICALNHATPFKGEEDSGIFIGEDSGDDMWPPDWMYLHTNIHKSRRTMQTVEILKSHGIHCISNMRGKRKKSHDARSGECGGCGRTVTCCLASSSWVSTDRIAATASSFCARAQDAYDELNPVDGEGSLQLILVG